MFFITAYFLLFDRTPRYDDGLPLAPEVPPHAIKSSPIDLVCPVSILKTASESEHRFYFLF